jgi:HEPN domain-containing protein
LAPYATGIRYPGELPEISHEDAREALLAAEAIWAFVLGLLPRDLQIPLSLDDSN